MLVLSIVALSTMGQYASSASMSGRLETLLAAPMGFGTAVALSSVPMMVFGIINFVLTLASIMYAALRVKGVVKPLRILGQQKVLKC